MEERIISLTEAQQLLKGFPEQFSTTCPTMIITRDDQPVLSLMPYEAHQALLENIASLQTMLEIMVGPVPKAARQPDQGCTPCVHRLTWEEFQKEVGWE